LAEASVSYVGDRAIELDLVDGVRISYRPPGGLTKEDYDFFGIEGYRDEPTPAPSAPPPAPPNTLASFRSTWFHAKTEQAPAAFRYGPLAGTQRELAAKIFPGVRIDTRRLQRKAALGASIWVRKQHRTLYEVWFRHEHDHAQATGRPIPASPP
jgi:hypothetical protein